MIPQFFALSVSTSDQVQTALSTAFTAVQGDIVKMILVALPIGLTVMGLSVAIRYGVKFFKTVLK